jgi:hypothetical protein
MGVIDWRGIARSKGRRKRGLEDSFFLVAAGTYGDFGESLVDLETTDSEKVVSEESIHWARSVPDVERAAISLVRRAL